MPLNAFLLVALAAFAHATWNFLAKRAAQNEHLIWFSSVTEALALAPVAAWILRTAWTRLGVTALACLLATGILHVLYTESLLRGYRTGDLTLVYPLARGSGPLLAFVGAVVLLRERPTTLAIAGALLISLGILLASGGLAALKRDTHHAGLIWGLTTGFIIACYTLVDGYSVKVLLVAPLLVEYAGNLFRTVVLTASACKQRARLKGEYACCWREATGIALLTPAGYVLVLFAMRLAPISRVAPVREMSMMVGMYLGARFLGEGQMARRVTASALIVLGVAALALG